jgi:hypothetical protein
MPASCYAAWEATKKTARSLSLPGLVRMYHVIFDYVSAITSVCQAGAILGVVRKRYMKIRHSGPCGSRVKEEGGREVEPGEG